MDKALPRYGGAGIKSGVTQVTPLLHVKTPQGEQDGYGMHPMRLLAALISVRRAERHSSAI